MNKITKEQAEEWLGIVQSGLVGREYRDVFLRLPEILREHIDQIKALDEHELEQRKYRYVIGEQIERIRKLEAENQSLGAEIGYDLEEATLP